MSVIYFGQSPPLLRDLETVVQPSFLGAEEPLSVDKLVGFKEASTADHKLRMTNKRRFPLVTS